MPERGPAVTAPTEGAPAGTAGDNAASTGQTPATIPAGQTPADTISTRDNDGDRDGDRRGRTREGDTRSASRDDTGPRDESRRDRDRDTGRNRDRDRDRDRDDDADTSGRRTRTRGRNSDDTDDADASRARIEELPEDAQQYIKRLRQENQTRRTEAADAAKAAKAAETRASEGDGRLEKAIAAVTTALGLTPDVEGETERTPEERLTEISGRYHEAQVELAVFRAAGEHEGDARALTDSRSFMRQAHRLDPTAEDFDDKIADLIAAQVEKDPKMRAETRRTAVVAPTRSGGDFGAGSTRRSDEDKSVDELRKDRRDRGRGNSY